MERLDDGRMNLLITGASRFRIRSLDDSLPYLRANISYVAEPDDQPSRSLSVALVSAFTAYLRGVREVSASAAELPRQLPDEAETLSYLVAAAIEGSVASRQQLLEAPTLVERMELQVAALRREADLLRRHVVRASPVAGSFSATRPQGLGRPPHVGAAGRLRRRCGVAFAGSGGAQLGAGGRAWLGHAAAPGRRQRRALGRRYQRCCPGHRCRLSRRAGRREARLGRRREERKELRLRRRALGLACGRERRSGHRGLPRRGGGNQPRAWPQGAPQAPHVGTREGGQQEGWRRRRTGAVG